MKAQHRSTVLGQWRLPRARSTLARGPRGSLGRSLEQDGTYRFDPARGRAACTRSTRRRRQCQARFTSVTCSLYPDRHCRPLPTDDRQGGLLPDRLDDNGLPTERRVQDYFGSVATRPALRRGLHPSAAGAQTREERTCVPISRPNFIQLCNILIAETSRPLSGCSASSEPRSTGPSTTRRSARYRGELRSAVSSASWHAIRPTGKRLRRCGTSTSRPRFAQAELVDKEDPGFYHRLRFVRPSNDGHPVEIETIDLSCAGLCRARRHPADERYQSLFGAEC